MPALRPGRSFSHPTRHAKIFAPCCATALLPYPEDPSTWLQNFTTHFGRFGWDFVISPAILNHFNFGYNRSNSSNFAFATYDNTNYGQQLGIANAPLSKNFPGITFDSRDLYVGLGNTLNNDWVDNGFRFNESISIAKGRNSLKFGVDFRTQPVLTTVLSNTESGLRSRAGRHRTPQIRSLTGNSLASLLLGQTSTGNFGNGLISSLPRWMSYYYALFAQDDLKVSNKLTLNLGIRWDVDVPRSAAHNYTSNFSPTANDPEYNIPGALVFGTEDKGNTRWANTYYKDIQPRLGFAFTPFASGNTVFRGGAGIIAGPLSYADDGMT